MQNERSDLTFSPLIILSSSMDISPRVAGGTNILLRSERCCLDARDLCDVGRCSRRGANFFYTGSTDYTASPHSAHASAPPGLTATDFLIYRFLFLCCLTLWRLSRQTIYDDSLQRRGIFNNYNSLSLESLSEHLTSYLIFILSQLLSYKKQKCFSLIFQLKKRNTWRPNVLLTK